MHGGYGDDQAECRARVGLKQIYTAEKLAF